MSKQTPIKQPPGRSVAYWLREALINSRKAGDDPEILRVDIAAKLRKDQSTIAKYETGVPRLPAEIDRYVAAYAEAAGLADSRDLWDEAMRLWRLHGSPPLLQPGELERPTQAAERLARETGQRQRQSRAESKETPRATRRRRASS